MEHKQIELENELDQIFGKLGFATRKYTCFNLKKLIFLVIKKEVLQLVRDSRKTVNPTCEHHAGRIFAYFFSAATFRAPSDEGAVSEAD